MSWDSSACGAVEEEAPTTTGADSEARSGSSAKSGEGHGHAFKTDEEESEDFQEMFGGKLALSDGASSKITNELIWAVAAESQSAPREAS
ncbi:hypothetical protein WOLCODRAFT_138597 [Wolfiporia cocos MD-104 SS10]|uniref:Uncharacterized protein n=1 Tax=Wolfiporia cocos (strain MD-104) TaxID=742152 RepID=A0A2H3K429_WOLCO|nr:hypothetical protein WOLCODRAFT_138597 [Wolfiporia cocos MD-104 SS10]